MNRSRRVPYYALAVAAVCLLPVLVHAATGGSAVPRLSIAIDRATEGGDVAMVLEIFLLLTVLSLAPAILILTTAFTRIVIVLSVLRQAIGTQQMPPNQVIVGLALFLTFFVMQPVLVQMDQLALRPYLSEEISLTRALEVSAGPLRGFMARQTREKDLALFTEMGHLDRPRTMEDVPLYVLAPAFVISELKTAFEIAFLLYVPFLIVDMVVASVLLSMGMMMLPPVMVSLPFKMMIFVLADGWHLIVGSLVKSFR